MEEPAEIQQLELAYRHLADVGGLLQLTDSTLLRIGGRDATRFLHSMTTNDVRQLAVDQGCECFVTDVRGKTVGHGFLVRLADQEPEYLFLGAPGQAATLIGHWDRYILSEDVHFEDATPEFACLAISRRLLTPNPEPVAESTSIRWVPVSCDVVSMPLAAHALTCNIHGPEFCLLVLAATDASRLVEQAAAAGWSVNVRTAWEALRVENGFPRYGVDLSHETLPQEVGRNEQAISFRKGCYLGQETIARIDALGHVNWYLVRMRADFPLTAGMEIVADGKTVAKIGSVVYSPRYSSELALAYVRRGSQAVGTAIAVDLGQLEVLGLH